MSDFRYVGQVPASKSIFNRALIIHSFYPHLKIRGESEADDVVHMRRALAEFKRGEPMTCGAAGTVFRFMALRCTRAPGKYRLTGDERLLARPQTELLKVLGQLGMMPDLTPTHLDVRSWGWKMVGDALHVPMERSSQFASAVLLSAWELPFEVCLLLGPHPVSLAYLEMTLALVRSLGMRVDRHGHELRIPSGQVVTAEEVQIEPDMSSAFALAAAAAVAGRVTLTGMPEASIQPDARFIPLLGQMSVPVLLQRGRLEVQKAAAIKAVGANLSDTPDLFPVLGALAALANGESHLSGAPHLVHKESNRIQRTVELLRLCGRDVTVFEDGIKVIGQAKVKLTDRVTFDPDHDHRMAMAAAILKLAGEPIQILRPEVVNKSFPGFWEAVGIRP